MQLAEKWSEVTSDLAPGKTHPVNVMAAYAKRNAPPKVEKPKAVKMAEKWAVLQPLQDSAVHPTRVMAAYRASLPKPPKVEKWAELTHRGSSTLVHPKRVMATNWSSCAGHKTNAVHPDKVRADYRKAAAALAPRKPKATPKAHAGAAEAPARSNAMWVTEHWSVLAAVKTTIVHPNDVRQEHRKLTAPKAPRPPPRPHPRPTLALLKPPPQADRTARSNAMWVTEHWAVLTAIRTDGRHHVRIRFRSRYGISAGCGKRHPRWHVQPAAHSGVGCRAWVKEAFPGMHTRCGPPRSPTPRSYRTMR